MLPDPKPEQPKKKPKPKPKPQRTRTHTLGRPPHVRNEALAGKIKLLSAMGLTNVEIGLVVELSAPTITKYYGRECEVGALEAHANVAQSLYRAATDKLKPNVVACIFYLKCRAGWREDGEQGNLGKKELVDLLSRVSDKGTSWDKLLSPNSRGSGDGRAE
jgi:hypothetical protein